VDNSDVPRKLDALVKKALSVNPNDRFSSGAEMAEAIEQLNGKAWNRRKLMGWLSQLFPKDFTVTCEVCGKQVAPGELCGECGTQSPSHDAEVAPMSVASIPAIDSGPLPLPPPPTSASGRVLSLVKPAEAAPAPVDGSEALDQMSVLAPAPRDSSFEPNVIDKTPVDGLPPLEPQEPKVIAEDYIEPPTTARPAAFDAPSTTRSTTRPKLFVVRDDDSVVMGLPHDTRVMDPPTSSQSRPTVVAGPHGHAHAQAPLTPRLSTVTTRPMPAINDAPLDLRPRTTGWKLAFALLIGGGIAALGTMIVVQTTPRRTEPVAVSLPSEAPKPVVTRPIVQQAPVVVTAPEPKPVVAPKLEAPKVVEEAALPAKPAVTRAAPSRKRAVHHRERAAEPAQAKPTVREGRIVDPFAGSD
jgi:hypothetical protein